MAKYLSMKGYEVHTLSIGTTGRITELKTMDRSVNQHFVINNSRRIYDEFKFSSSLWGYAKQLLYRGELVLFIRKSLNYLQKILLGDSFFLDSFLFFKKARQLIRKHGINLVLVSSPPHGLNFSILLLKMFFSKVKVVLDYRDSWNTREVRRKKVLNSLVVSLERKILSSVDRLIFATSGMAEIVQEKIGGFDPKIVQVITNGFDDITGDAVYNSGGCTRRRETPIIGYFGTGAMASNNASDGTDVFNFFVRNGLHKKFQFRFIGNYEFSPTFLQNHEGFITSESQVNHSEAVAKMAECDFLSIIYVEKKDAKEVLSGKFFDYVATRRPIILFGVSELEELRALLKEKRIGFFANVGDEEGFVSTIEDMHEKYIGNKSMIDENLDIKEFSRSYQYDLLVAVFQDLMDSKLTCELDHQAP